MHIIIKGKGQAKFGRTRSEQEGNLRREGMKSMDDGQLDKLRFIERKAREMTGSTQNFIGQETIDEVK